MITRLWMRFVGALFDLFMRTVAGHHPDFIVGPGSDPYLCRWWIIPRNPVFNIYLHVFLKSDDDRALHDHPWFWASLMLSGSYVEHTIDAGGIHREEIVRAGRLRFGTPWRAHRVELREGSCMTLFITGPRLRHWGFHCPRAGWVHWRDFTDPASGGARVGKGCDQ